MKLMQWHRTLLVGCLFVLGMQAETALSRPADFNPIIFASTGHKSCTGDESGRKNSPYNTTLQPHLVKVIEQIKETYDNVEPKIILGCFEYGREPFGGRQTFRYTMPDNEIATVEMGKKALFDKIDYEYMVPSIDAAIGRINQVINETDNHVLYLVGHSWGAWLSMKLATLLPPDIHLGALVTIDPISPLDCWPNQFIRLGRGYIKNCKQPPRDIDPIEQLRIFDKVGGEWMHYYQRQFYFAKSGPMAILKEGLRSFKIKIKKWSINHHSKLQKEPSIWKNLTQTLKRRL